LQRLLKAARFKVDARIEGVDYQQPRGLIRSQVAGLLTGEWIAKNQNLIITGPMGCGKTYLACAIDHHARHFGYSVRYYRTPRLFESLTISHGDGSFLKLINQLTKAELLIIDDWDWRRYRNVSEMTY